jgi:hypothetical protein
MPKQIVVLDPNGVEVAMRWAEPMHGETEQDAWEGEAERVGRELGRYLRENPKLGTYTVTVKEVE